MTFVMRPVGAEIANCLEASVAEHRADFERERNRCDRLIAETLVLNKVAMSAQRRPHNAFFARAEPERAAEAVSRLDRRQCCPAAASRRPERLVDLSEIQYRPALTRPRSRAAFSPPRGNARLPSSLLGQALCSHRCSSPAG